MFIGADSFLRLLAAYRVCWVSGRFGGGKTSLGVWLAAWLVDQRHALQVVSNLPVRDAVRPAPVPLRDAALLVDESWLFLDTWDDVRNYAAFLRKFNLYLLMPSVWPPHYRLRILEVHRVFNGRVVGLPLWFYRWSLQMASIKEKGYFALAFPERVFSLYDTRYIPADDGGIVQALASTIDVEVGHGFRLGSRNVGASAGIAAIEDIARRIDVAADVSEVSRWVKPGRS